MNNGLLLWYAARVAALAAFTVLAASLLTGMALRTALFASLARNRAVLAVHGFLAWFWVPLLVVHLAALLLDATARIHPLDLVIPFRAAYGTTGIGLGTVGLLGVVLVGASGGLRRHLGRRTWTWIHRLSYPMFAVFLLHAQLVGTDFSRTGVSLVGWGTLGALAALTLLRVSGGRVDVPALRG